MCEVNILVPEFTPEDHIQKREDLKVLHAWFNLRAGKARSQLDNQDNLYYSEGSEPILHLHEFKEPKP